MLPSFKCGVRSPECGAAESTSSREEENEDEEEDERGHRGACGAEE